MSTPSDTPPKPRLRSALVLTAAAAVLTTVVLAVLLGVVVRTNSKQQQTIADQQATIDALQAKGPIVVYNQPAGPAPSASASVEPLPQVGQQRRAGTLVLPFSYCADLESDAEDWAMTNADCGKGRDILLGQDFQGLKAAASVAIAVAPREQATYAGCPAGTPGGSVPYSDLKPKTFVCVRPGGGVVAILEVVTVEGGPTAPAKVTFNVTVWNRA
ncbi:hypothetical protein ACQP00_04950 [Dactylosporangium sp. CS-047395]|uniref:hypothetical protein n=1 Tax=Dactylosporangium sp. CS-047395 TaxID=3239936 RepID=UPI003D94D1C9